MANVIEKIIQQPTAPKSKNVLWDDGKNLKINRNSKWEEVNKKEEISTPDWNAKEEEPGYIKNKPFYQNDKTNGLQPITVGKSLEEIYIKQQYDEVSRVNIYSDSNKTNLLKSIDISNIEDYNNFEGYSYSIEYNENIIDIQLYFTSPDWYNLCLVITTRKASEIGEEYITIYYELVNDSVKTLDEKYIPKTIVRTSDLNFNTFVLRYTLNPYIIRPGEVIPGIDGGPDDIGTYVFATGSLRETLLTMFIVEIIDENYNSTYYKITKVVNDSTNYEDYRIGGDFGELKLNTYNGTFELV